MKLNIISVSGFEGEKIKNGGFLPFSGWLNFSMARSLRSRRPDRSFHSEIEWMRRDAPGSAIRLAGEWPFENCAYSNPGCFQRFLGISPWISGINMNSNIISVFGIGGEMSKSGGFPPFLAWQNFVEPCLNP